MAEAWRLMILLLSLVPAAGCLPGDFAAEQASLADRIFGSLPWHSAAYHERCLASAAERAESAAGFGQLAVAQLRLGHPQRAVELLQTARRRWPEEGATLELLGTALAHAGRLEEAVATLTESIGTVPGDGCRQLELWLLKHELSTGGEPAPAPLSFLGFEFAARLGAGFRGAALGGDDARSRDLARRHLLNRLDLPATALDDLLRLLDSYPEHPELYFTLGELLAAMGERPLAWHAYQRALDLGHPRAADLPWYQTQVRDTLPRGARGPLSEVSHYHARRRALDWVAARQRFEQELLEAGQNPNDPALFERFDRDHPRPRYEF